MRKFFKYVFASALGFVFAGGVLLVLFFGMLFGLISSVEGKFGSDKKEITIKNNSIYHLKLNSMIEERAADDPFSELDLGPFSGESTMGLRQIVQSIDYAATDDNIKGILLELYTFPGGLGALEEVRMALKRFKESGKWVVAYSESMTQGGYYLASVSDEIYLYPEGDILFKGLGTNIMYMKGMLDKLDIEMQAIKGPNNIYKSAVEPLTADEMSEANREQIKAYLSSIWGHWLTGISAEREIPYDNLNSWADSLTIRNAGIAVKMGLIDGLKYRDQLLDDLVSRMELEDESDLNVIKYSKMKKKKVKSSADYDAKKIAIIYADGEIRPGKSTDGVMGSATIAKAIKTARLDSNVKAIVLRVNSPGGSALASDVMWRETVLAKKEKPLIVSMGNLAASGGYYISCNADKIYANETTITGSIGVFGLMPVMDKFFKNKMGITFQGEQTNAHAQFPNGIDRLDEEEYEVINSSIIHIYDDFISKVADGRGLTKEQVNEVARGRVWTGEDALDIGLVDEIGTLDDAVAYAASQANLDDYRLKELPEMKDPFESIFGSMQARISTSFMKENFGAAFQYFEIIEDVKSMSGVQARMPFNIEIY